MIYSGKNRQLLRAGMKVWACAYSTDNNREIMGLIQKPVYGVVDNWYEDSKEVYPDAFYKFKRGTEEKCKQFVGIGAREYADTYEECVEIYNSIVKRRIEWLRAMANKAAEDYIDEEKTNGD